MHIGIVELCEKNHHSMIYSWIKIANLNKWKITLFTTKEIFSSVRSELKNLNYNLIIKENNAFFFQIKIRNLVKEKKINKLIYLTICNYLVYLFVSLKSLNFGITVHNSNLWFKNNNNKNFKYYLRAAIINKLKKNASFFIVNSINMKNYIDNNFNQIKPIYVLPFSLRKNKIKNKKKNDKFTTVYPGSINYLRRRYNNYIKLAKLNPNDQFIVLGGLNENNINHNIYHNLNGVKNIITYKKFIKIKNFTEVIQNSHLLFYDIRVNYNSEGISEVYGLSKDSGISYLMNEFNMPSLINDQFINLNELRNGTLHYKNFTTLLKKYKKIKNNEKRLFLIKKIKKDTKDLNINIFARKFNNIFK